MGRTHTLAYLCSSLTLDAEFHVHKMHILAGACSRSEGDANL